MTRSLDVKPSIKDLGYTDEKLESLSDLKTRFETGLTPWVMWESENSSFGKTLREWAFFPKFLPLFISADHGVNWASRCWPNEVSRPYSTYFTWNKKKCDLMIKDHGKKAYHVPHPWVHYRKKHYKQLPDKRSGTLVFYAHSNDTTTPVYSDIDKYINDLESLPEKYQPIVICLSFHDIRKGLHKKLRKYNLPIVTAGTTSSQQFVDRFYTLLYQHKYASSSNIGSHTYYIIEAGVPFFLYGPYPEYHIKGSKIVVDGIQNLTDYGDDEDIAEFKKLIEILSFPSDEITDDQLDIVSRSMGLDSEMKRFHAFIILWRELFLNIDDAILSYTPIVKKIFSRIYKKTP